MHNLFSLKNDSYGPHVFQSQPEQPLNIAEGGAGAQSEFRNALY